MPSPDLPTPRLTAPMPTAFRSWGRRFLPIQLLRFLWINVRMVVMIVLSHPRRVPDARP